MRGELSMQKDRINEKLERVNCYGQYSYGHDITAKIKFDLIFLLFFQLWHIQHSQVEFQQGRSHRTGQRRAEAGGGYAY